MFKLSSGITVSVKDEIFAVAGEKLIEGLSLFFGIEAKETSGKADITIYKADLEEEEYSLRVTDDGIVIGASHIRGALYGASTLIQMVNDKLELASCHITDKPNKSFRGIHTYLPARENIEQYKRILDVVAFLKLNTVIIETSGAVEYYRHPEINKSWEQFCHIAEDLFPGYTKSSGLQWSDIYWKDSVHPEHAGGSYLKKEEVRDIVAYAKKLGITVIPEIQALSHSYYLAISHREIAELQDDPFPDSFCPLNEKSYELYFDVAEEIIDIFQPEIVSIGHDEIRVLGQCEKCREKTGHELLAYEINRLHEFYKSKGIRIMMWAEKLQDLTTYLGEKAGGNAVDKITSYAFRGFRYTLPATNEAIDMIPRDVIMLDWYWSLAHDSTDCFNERGFTTVFGNFKGSRMYGYDKRSDNDAVIGAEVSTWCVADEKTFAHDGCFFEFAFSAEVLWNNDYEPSQYGKYCQKINFILDFAKCIMRAKSNALRSGGKLSLVEAPEASENKFEISSASCAKNYVKTALSGVSDKLFGVRIDENMFLVKKEFKADSLLIVHSATKNMDYASTYSYPDERKWDLGTYVVIYEDGTIELINAPFGRAVGPMELNLDKVLGTGTSKESEIDIDVGNNASDVPPPAYKVDCGWLPSLTYETTPLYSGDTAVFAYEWENPHPDKSITMIKAINASRDPEQVIMLYGIFAINEK